MQSLQICSEAPGRAPPTTWQRRCSHSALRLACSILMETLEDFKHFGANLPSVFEDKQASPEKDVPSFPQFRRLPLELRLAIWEYALPEAAVIPRVWNNDKQTFGLSRPVPSVLQVCLESRHALITCCPEHDKSGTKYQLTSNPGGVFVNWARDSIWISRGCELQHLACHCVVLVRLG